MEELPAILSDMGRMEDMSRMEDMGRMEDSFSSIEAVGVTLGGDMGRTLQETCRDATGDSGGLRHVARSAADSRSRISSCVKRSRATDS
jgi:hypothetical protein